MAYPPESRGRRGLPRRFDFMLCARSRSRCPGRRPGYGTDPAGTNIRSGPRLEQPDQQGSRRRHGPGREPKCHCRMAPSMHRTALAPQFNPLRSRESPTQRSHNVANECLSIHPRGTILTCQHIGAQKNFMTSHRFVSLATQNGRGTRERLRVARLWVEKLPCAQAQKILSVADNGVDDVRCGLHG